MATYFDLIARPNDPIKSKTTGKFLKLSNSSNDLKVPNDWVVKSGDVLPCSDYRTTDTYFITHDNTLLKNPDTSAAGYLTIPFSISSLVLDTVILLFFYLLFVSHFSKEPLPKSIINRNDISYSFDPNDKIYYVMISSNPNRCQDFSLNITKTNDIIN
ncbi:unnamed protein product [Rotaria sp. Silwood1]|nr:unnamed protein product [Rotaria sp. Silwood1]